MELVAVVTLLGMFAAVAASRSDGFFADAKARTEAETLAALLHDARRRAILTGDSHGVDFVRSGGDVLSYQLTRETSPGVWTGVEDAVPTPAGLSITSGSDNARYSFEGTPLHGGVTVTCWGPHQDWQIWMPPLAGSIRVTRLP
ncbi:MAG: hypothetical protein AAF907_00800 [Planctomycetota bacterium]